MKNKKPIIYPYAEVIKKHRIKLGFGQQHLADLLGEDKQTVSNWELGKNNPAAEKLPAIAKHLQIDGNELLGLESNGTRYYDASKIEDQFEKQNEENKKREARQIKNTKFVVQIGLEIMGILMFIIALLINSLCAKTTLNIVCTVICCVSASIIIFLAIFFDKINKKKGE